MVAISMINRGTDVHVLPRHGLGQTQGIHGNETAEADEDNVDGMGASIDQPVNLLGAVMDGVEAPEQRDLMRPAMPPIETKFTNHQGRSEAPPER